MSRVHDQPISDETRRATLERAVADLKTQGWHRDLKRDNERVLVGHNQFRQLLVKSRRPLGSRRELVEVDKHGEIVITRI